MPSLYIPPNQPSPEFAAYLKTSTRKTNPEPHVYRDSEMVRAATTSPPKSTSDSPIPPASPRPTPLDLDTDIFCKRIASPGSRLKDYRRHKTSRYIHPHPKLRIKNPKTTPVDPHDLPAPLYHDWHPTSVMWEYQLQRGLGVSERVFELCRFFNKASSEERGRVGDAVVWKGHEHRVEWLYWYWGEKDRKRGVRTAREADEMIEREQERIVREVERKKAENGERAWNGQEVSRKEDDDKLENRDLGVMETVEAELAEESRNEPKPHRRVSLNSREENSAKRRRH
ncbi:MAG: hypothetical protein Q9207_006448 [Kuettlingeria erythrocarpa]